MPLFLITGSAGVGKSVVCRVLKARGYEALDTDDDALSRWQHNVTGYVHPKSSVKAHQRTPEFLSDHTWSVPREFFIDLRKRAGGKPVFVCGAMGNEDKVRDLFDAVFALYVDEETLKHRLATRTGNDWGKRPNELAYTLERYRVMYDGYRSRSDYIIDATKPVNEVADEILIQIEAL